VDQTPAPDILFYDGYCGLCHRTVQFVVREDREGNAFRFAPLQGETFSRLVPRAIRETLPDSLVVMASDRQLYVRSDAFLRILRRLGGGWKALAAMLSVVPRGLRDFAYDFVARVRFRIFGQREDLCPVMPPELRARFDN
jgi:predicted DCC family thiol-disulfide oxidoreductase YuxK